MKTNKDERTAIATKFYNRMEEQMPVKQTELEKSSLFKEATKLTKEINKLNKVGSYSFKCAKLIVKHVVFRRRFLFICER